MFGLSPQTLQDIARFLRLVDPYLVPFLFGFACSIVLTRVSIWAAFRTGALAYPNHRSLHESPTPRLGGLGLGATVLVGLALIVWRDRFGESHLAVFEPPLYLVPLLLFGGAGALVLGLADDLFDLSVWPKLAGQFVVASVAVLPIVFRLLKAAQNDALTGRYLAAQILLALLSLLWILVFLNVLNFMDGIDGQALLISLIATIAFLLLIAGNAGEWLFGGAGYHDIFLMSFFVMVGGAVIGLLTFNYPPAMTFLGDTGSHFLGYLWGVLSLYFCFYGSLPPDSIGRAVAIWQDELILRLDGFIVLFGPLLFDFFYTLNRRIVQGHSPATPHREHLYQRLVMAGYSHAEVFRLHLVYYGWNALMALTILEIGLPLWVRWGAFVAAFVSWYAYLLFVERVERTARATGVLVDDDN